MSKMQIAIINILSEKDRWMTADEIAMHVGIKRSSVRVSLTSMCARELVTQKDNADGKPGYFYRLSHGKSGFGVSQRIAAFEKCLSVVRQ